jgi:hypothetical protein
VEVVSVTDVVLGVMALFVVAFLLGLLTRRIRIDRCCGIPPERDARMRDAFAETGSPPSS